MKKENGEAKKTKHNSLNLSAEDEKRLIFEYEKLAKDCFEAEEKGLPMPDVQIGEFVNKESVIKNNKCYLQFYIGKIIHIGSASVAYDILKSQGRKQSEFTYEALKYYFKNIDDLSQKSLFKTSIGILSTLRYRKAELRINDKEDVKNLLELTENDLIYVRLFNNSLCEALPKENKYIRQPPAFLGFNADNPASVAIFNFLYLLGMNHRVAILVDAILNYALLCDTNITVEIQKSLGDRYIIEEINKYKSSSEEEKEAQIESLFQVFQVCDKMKVSLHPTFDAGIKSAYDEIPLSATKKFFR